MYRKDLVDKPAVLIVNKMDIKGAEQLYESLVDRVKNMAGMYLRNIICFFDSRVAFMPEDWIQ
jgi:GTPase involved in cell partitioning and DNA repair